MIKFLPLYFFFIVLIILSGCAKTQYLPDGYVGAARGLYATAYYRVEGNGITIAFENTTTTAMSNLTVSVSQRTTAGREEMQSSTRILKVKNLMHIDLAIAHNSTGDVTVNYYFTPLSEGAIGMTPYQKGDFADNNPLSEYGAVYDDTITFKINVK